MGFVIGFAVMIFLSLNPDKNDIGITATNQDVENHNNQVQVKDDKTNAQVIKVADGDTITVVLDSEPDKEYKVRFLGVNTPETVDPRKPVECFGKQASDYTKSQLQDARILLKADPEADEIDKYGRILRNVYLEDGTDFCAKLIQMGYAYAYTTFPMNEQRKTELRVLEREAKEAGIGLWSDDACN